MRIKIISGILSIILCMSGCASSDTLVLSDGIGEQSITKDQAYEIVKAYNIVKMPENFEETTVLQYDKVFNYFLYAGFYQNNAVRSELQKYLNEDGVYEIPVNIVDHYLSKKFNTSVNRKLIPFYREDTDTYQLTPFQGEFYYDIEVSSLKEVDPKIYEFISFLSLNADDPIKNSSQQKFVIFVDNGCYKFLEHQVL